MVWSYVLPHNVVLERGSAWRTTPSFLKLLFNAVSRRAVRCIACLWIWKKHTIQSIVLNCGSTWAPRCLYKMQTCLVPSNLFMLICMFGCRKMWVINLVLSLLNLGLNRVAPSAPYSFLAILIEYILLLSPISLLGALHTLIWYLCSPHNYGFSCSQMMLCCWVLACQASNTCSCPFNNFAVTVNLILVRIRPSSLSVVKTAICTLTGILCNLATSVSNVCTLLSTWAWCSMLRHQPNVWSVVSYVGLGSPLLG